MKRSNALLQLEVILFMKSLVHLLYKVEKVHFTEKWACIKQLDNALQDVLFHLDAINHKASGELIELKSCSWVLHERYHMDNEEQMKWTFHHTKHKIIRSCRSLLEQDESKKRRAADFAKKNKQPTITVAALSKAF